MSCKPYPKVVGTMKVIVAFVATSVTALSTYNPVCYDDNTLFQSDYALRAIANARAELGLESETLKLPRKWHTFFAYRPYKCIVVPTPAACFAYLTIFKCGNVAIRSSLTEQNADVPDEYRAEEHECKSIREFAQAECPTKPSVSFTFVREPLSHFLSGYGEYMYREYVGSNKEIAHTGLFDELRSMVKPKDEPHRFVVELVTGLDEAYLFANGVNEKHMSLMSMSPHVHGESPIEYVGHLSHADEDWSELFEMGNITGTALEGMRLNPELGHHKSSWDQMGVRAEMRDLLLLNSTLRRAICYLIERDYLCFGYDFEACLNGSALLRHA